MPCVFVYAAVIVYPTSPSLEALTEYNPKIPLRIFSADGALIGEFGEERRAVIKIAEVPTPLKQAIVAAEDERFYEHGGVDYIGVLRAAVHNFSSGGSKQGASTITMQVARNFFDEEKTFTRKFNEALLAFKIEHSLSKDQILEIYINQIYLGQRAYGFASAAQVYFGKNLRDLNLPEMAMLAGLPKAPSRYNPVVQCNAPRSANCMFCVECGELEFIKQAQFDELTRQAADGQARPTRGIQRTQTSSRRWFGNRYTSAIRKRRTRVASGSIRRFPDPIKAPRMLL